MSEVEKSSEHSREAEHIEHAVKNERGAALDDVSFIDHRDNDDRAEEAMGRNSDKYEKRYWLSVNYIGSLFAIGMAFMGGIGGIACDHVPLKESR